MATGAVFCQLVAGLLAQCYIYGMKYNGFNLPGFDTTRPPHKHPRWMIVWDDNGWTVPVRRIIVEFNGKFVEKSGPSWDHGSELPDEFMGPLFRAWRELHWPTKLQYEYEQFIQKYHNSKVPVKTFEHAYFNMGVLTVYALAYVQQTMGKTAYITDLKTGSATSYEDEGLRYESKEMAQEALDTFHAMHPAPKHRARIIKVDISM